MANKHGVSANAIKKRVKKMLETGSIEGFSVELSLAMLDAEVVMCLAYTDGTEDENTFIEEIGNNYMVSTIGKHYW